MCCVQVLKLSDCCLPVACCPGQPFRAVARATVESYSQLGIAFIEDRLQLDNGLTPSKIVRMLSSSRFSTMLLLHGITPQFLTHVSFALSIMLISVINKAQQKQHLESFRCQYLYLVTVEKAMRIVLKFCWSGLAPPLYQTS